MNSTISKDFLSLGIYSTYLLKVECKTLSKRIIIRLDIFLNEINKVYNNLPLI